MHGRRVFGVHQFFYRFDRSFFWPAVGLNPKPLNLLLLRQIAAVDGNDRAGCVA
jgi:hypothetical protein